MIVYQTYLFFMPRLQCLCVRGAYYGTQTISIQSIGTEYSKHSWPRLLQKLKIFFTCNVSGVTYTWVNLVSWYQFCSTIWKSLSISLKTIAIFSSLSVKRVHFVSWVAAIQTALLILMQVYLWDALIGHNIKTTCKWNWWHYTTLLYSESWHTWMLFDPLNH